MSDDAKLAGQSVKDKVEGKFREVKGAATGDSGEEAKGKAQGAKGEVEKNAARVREDVDDSKEH